ncbi:Ala-tRNA(Pro) deacylase [Ferrimonas sediminum]|uniref:Ala-tRNA(Pro) deacylase n=1 Tax=Ferrimonas sediminum TaxID=718193 RepID=A0A1G8VFD6_9GAMM|nr:YbaK/EbsC family protein [Ferrimonas sediminum]SDJ64792.1 Ala-tRNA(Pro) deacylase [Ferrimonas sediminum]
MGVAISVIDYLEELGVQYQLVPHAHSQSSIQSALSAGVSARQTAKSVMLEDNEGRRVMAVIPAANRVVIQQLSQQLKRELHLIPESKLKGQFDDCELGALPGVGDPYNVLAVYDDALEGEDHVYLEAGDHEHLIRISNQGMKALMADHPHGRFSATAVYNEKPRRAWDWQ